MRTNLIDNRQIRVFISSTFRDMQDERDYLMKRTFPKLRKLAAERDVTLTELDLRWGITEEEARTGRVVEICLREIENSIPFFIGIIGNRYGWVPEKNDLSANVTERFPDVNTFIGQHLSVTEMEMQFGVLQREEDMHAYFYIKDKMEEQDNPEMLNRLKAEVEASRYPSSTYSSPEDLAEQVEQAFIALLDHLFPEGNISKLEKERIGQRSFMHQLCQNYIRDEKNFKVLDDWMQDWEQHQMVITGASGLGKSALIANWLNEKLQDKDRGYNIIYHFTGNGGSESSHDQIMKVLIDEINDVYGWESEKELNKSQEDKLNELFIRVASEGKKPLLIVLDAINQIIDTDNAKLLNWLPFPPKIIKILFSTLEDDRTMEVFKNRHYPTFVLQPIEIEHREQLIHEYLQQFGKKLTDVQIERIANDSQCENTLVLKTTLDELINFGIYEKLDERIDYYLSQDTIEGFYQTLLKSYEEEFGKEFVKHILSLVVVSRNGLSEDEITSLIKCNPIDWSQFYCAILNHLTNRGGLISLSHSNISNAIITRYLKDDVLYVQCHKSIISYFEMIESIRSWDELAYQYKKYKEPDKLLSLFGNPKVMSYFLRKDSVELWSYWQEIVTNSGQFDMLVYIPAFKNDFNLLLLQSKFIITYLNDQETALEYLKVARTIMKEEDKAIFFNAMGEVYTDKANEFFRKELHILACNGKERSIEFADTIINIAKTNDMIGREVSVEIGNENEVELIKERIREDNIRKEKRESEIEKVIKEELGEIIYSDYKEIEEYHFEFENKLWGDDLQLAYVNEAISIIKSLNHNVYYKIAQYYSYIFDIFWLLPPADYFPLLEEALAYFVKLKTEKCPEVIRILMQMAVFLKHEYYNQEKDEIEPSNKRIAKEQLHDIHEKLLANSIAVYGKYSLKHIEALDAYAEYYELTKDYCKELDCFKTILVLYKELGMYEEANDIKDRIDNYYFPLAESSILS